MSQQRFVNARIAQSGASNSFRVATALVEAIRECQAASVTPAGDPACRLIAHQLAHLFNVDAFNMDSGSYTQAMDAVTDAAHAEAERRHEPCPPSCKPCGGAS